MTDGRIAYGFWRYGPNDLRIALEMLSCAREAGVTHFDTADIYGGRAHFGAAETLLGQARKAAPSLFKGVQIATKAGVEYGTPYNSSKDYLEKAINASLGRLDIECVDIWYIHRPDFLAHPQEVAEALDKAVTQGKVKAVGVSNYTPAQVNVLSAFLKAPIAAHQVEFSLLETAPLFNGVLDQTMEQKIPLYAWSPLAGGVVSQNTRIMTVLNDMAQEKGCTPAALALAFILRHPASITPIIGTKDPAHFREAMSALNITLTRAEWYSLLETSLGRRMP